MCWTMRQVQRVAAVGRNWLEAAKWRLHRTKYIPWIPWKWEVHVQVKNISSLLTFSQKWPSQGNGPVVVFWTIYCTGVSVKSAANWFFWVCAKSVRMTNVEKRIRTNKYTSLFCSCDSAEMFSTSTVMTQQYIASSKWSKRGNCREMTSSIRSNTENKS